MKVVALCTALILGCLALEVKGQDCNANNMEMCSSRCIPNSADGNCCLLDPNQADTDATPLGFIDMVLPGTDRLTEEGVDPPCVRAIFPTGTAGQRGVYLVVGLQTSGETVCINIAGRSPADATCGSGRIYFCEMVEPVTAGTRTILELDVFCVGAGASCSAADTSFFIRPNITDVGMDDEDFCDNFGTIPLPQDQLINPGTIVPGQPQTTFATTGGASPLKPLPLLLLLMAVLLAKWL